MDAVRRRDFMAMTGGLGFAGLLSSALGAPAAARPNLLFVFADQWRAQAAGYAGDPNLMGKTPHLDRLAGESVNLVNAVSNMPVCTPYRASLMTGQYAQTHGLFLNDAPLNPELMTIGKVYRQAGYETGYVGKWHLDGHGRTAFIPEERRHGFDYWKVLECSHKYSQSPYYEGDDPEKKWWKGYDAFAQTRDVRDVLSERARDGKAFALFLSWGPPHNPYRFAPEKFAAMFSPQSVQLRPNVPAAAADRARRDLAGYYAHIAALDQCLGDLMATLDETGLRDNTLLVFTSDHGNMLGSQRANGKQVPFDESIRVPFLVRWPKAFGEAGRRLDMPFGAPDIMPTLLGLSGLEVPGTVEGTDYSDVLRGRAAPENDAVVIECMAPFGEWHRGRGGREYRGVRTRRYTYVRDLTGPWLLFDNQKDPYQQTNLAGRPESALLQEKLDRLLMQKLQMRGDVFLTAEEYIRQWGYQVDRNGTIPLD